jgi:3-methylcrotonyl-CoA carboxylase alpha subunit
VEHPVTEAVTGLDLVAWQFRVAAGEKLPLAQRDIPLKGHAVEARIYAEDPARGFLPSTGTLVALRFPQGVRVDTGVEQGSAISPYYDPMIAKMIAHGASRNEALQKLAVAIEATVAAGPRTNLALLSALCRAPDFQAGTFDTGFIDRHPALLGSSEPDRAAAAFGVARLLAQETARIGQAVNCQSGAPASPWDAIDGFQLSGPRQVTLPFLADGEPAEARIAYGPAGTTITVEGEAAATDATVVEADAIYVLRHGRQTAVRRAEAGSGDLDHADGDGQIRAPMHGKVLALLVAEGDRVEKGQRLAIVEAMKMEHALTSRRAGRVTGIAVSVGTQVAEGAGLMTIEAEAGDPG